MRVWKIEGYLYVLEGYGSVVVYEERQDVLGRPFWARIVEHRQPTAKHMASWLESHAEDEIDPSQMGEAF